jgi:Transposase DDE domain
MALSRTSVAEQREFHSFFATFSALDEYALRRRVWGPMQAMYGVMALCEPGVTTSGPIACERVFEWMGSRMGMKEVPNPSGLCRSRAAMPDGDVHRLWTLIRTWSESNKVDTGESALLPGYRVAACDGTTLIMPRTASTSAAFTLQKDKKGNEQAHYPLGLLTSVWDVEMRIPLSYRLTAMDVAGGERGQLADMVWELPEKTVLVLDRGYPSHGLLGTMIEAECEFIVRMVASETGGWQEVRDFLKGGAKSATVTMLLKDSKGNERPHNVRLVRRIFNRGRPQQGQRRPIMVIATSLTDPSISDEKIIELYQRRWEIETIHRELKSLAACETWHSKTAKGIRQEVLAHLLWFTLIGHISARLVWERRQAAIAAGGSIGRMRTNTRRVMHAARSIATAVLSAATTSTKSVHQYFIRSADARLGQARKFIVPYRKRKSRPRKPLHPYARRQSQRGE